MICSQLFAESDSLVACLCLHRSLLLVLAGPPHVQQARSLGVLPARALRAHSLQKKPETGRPARDRPNCLVMSAARRSHSAVETVPSLRQCFFSFAQ